LADGHWIRSVDRLATRRLLY